MCSKPVDDFMPSEAVDALIVVDVQKAFVSGPEAVRGHDRLLAMVGLLLEEARAARAPVVFLQNDGAPGTVDEPFRPEWSLGDEIRIRASARQVRFLAPALTMRSR